MLSDPQQGASPRLSAKVAVPAVAEILGGSGAGSSGDRAIELTGTKGSLPDTANTPNLGAEGSLLPIPTVPQAQDRAILAMSTGYDVPDPASIAALRELQRQRQFCIVSQSRCDRACEAFIARYLGYRPDQTEAERAVVWKQAAALRRAVEKGGESPRSTDSQMMTALAACSPIILNSAAARDSWDKHRNQTEKAMRKLARSFPAWTWVESIAGFGDLGLGILIGETGDLAGYATKERVWKRLGLAVITGERQQRKSGAEAAAAHGYSPKRRAEVWTIADSMFRHQWRGAKDDAPAGPAGPYGAVYARRKAHTVTREWTPKHRDNDARRVMTKALIEDLWRVWRGMPPLCGSMKAN